MDHIWIHPIKHESEDGLGLEGSQVTNQGDLEEPSCGSQLNTPEDVSSTASMGKLVGVDVGRTPPSRGTRNTRLKTHRGRDHKHKQDEQSHR